MSHTRGNAQLFRAAAEGSREEVEQLIAEGADVDAIDDDDFTALLLAAERNPRTDVIGVLLDAGATLNWEGSSRLTPLHMAALGNTGEVVEYLLQRGANVEARDANRDTALHCAASYNPSTGVIRALLDAGSPLNVRGTRDLHWTPLHAAVWGNVPEVVEYLLWRGADVTARDNSGRTPLQIAQLRERWEVVTALWNGGAHL
eukprot:Sspe_Gene.23929::Locus_9374_Transcript_1_1_Confidence_1.000_Length_1180::g.23929::m.23929